MRSLVLALLTLLATSLLQQGSALALVNGSLVSDDRFDESYPWAVTVVASIMGGICGGVLIAPRWVLTAAHCTGLPKHVLLGHPKRSAGQRIEVSRAIRHPDFDIKTLQNDIGLLQLETAVEGPLAQLPSDLEAKLLLIPGAAATLIGWGKTETSRTPVDRLVEGRIKLNALNLYGSQINYTYIGGGPCGRDSGSPMLMRTLDGRQLVVGVASGTQGHLCGQGGGSATYTNVARVRKFIERFVTELSD